MPQAIYLEPFSVGSTDTGAIDLQDDLDAVVDGVETDETITGTVLLVEVTTANLTLGSKTANAAAMMVKGRSVAIAKGVTFTISGAASGVRYKMLLTVTTTKGRIKTYWVYMDAV